MISSVVDRKAPMSSAPMKYLPDGTVDWGNMWDSFCVLALDGGPPHRGTLLTAQETPNTQSETYQFAVQEIVRGIEAVSELKAQPAEPGWIAVVCQSPGMARWLSEAIAEENVQAKSDGDILFVPVGDYFTVKSEIKNVITAVAKTNHYWHEHLPTEVKYTLALQHHFAWWSHRLQTWLNL